VSEFEGRSEPATKQASAAQADLKAQAAAVNHPCVFTRSTLFRWRLADAAN
jgi:hypothetical protein